MPPRLERRQRPLATSCEWVRTDFKDGPVGLWTAAGVKETMALSVPVPVDTAGGENVMRELRSRKVPAARLTILLVVVIAATVAATPASAGLTLDKRLGNNTEGSTFIANGSNAGQVAVLDGYDVIGIPVNGKRAQPHTLFTTKGVGWAAFPSGIAYVPVDKTYVFDDQGALDQLTVVSATGQLLAPRPITYLPSSPPVFSAEGLVYLGDDSVFPDTIARAVWDGEFAYIEIMGRDGVVQRDIMTQLPPANAYITGLAYLSSGVFLVSTADENLWTIGVDGSVLSGPTPVADTFEIEGLTAVPGGRVYAAGYSAGVLRALDDKLRRDPSGDRPYPIGIGISRAFDAVWDPATAGWAFQGNDSSPLQGFIFTAPATLDSKTTLFPVPSFSLGLTELADGSFATCKFEHPEIDHYSRNGTFLGSIDLLAAGLPRRCTTLAYLPALDAYAVILRRNPSTVFIVSVGGTVLGSFPSAAPVAALSRAPDGPGDEVLAWEPATSTLETFHAPDGALISRRVLDVGPIVAPFGFAAGPGGTWAILDANDSEVAVFGP